MRSSGWLKGTARSARDMTFAQSKHHRGPRRPAGTCQHSGVVARAMGDDEVGSSKMKTKRKFEIARISGCNGSAVV